MISNSPAGPGTNRAGASAWPAWALFAGVIVLSAWRDGRYLFASPYPYGVDGYYYLHRLTVRPFTETVTGESPLLFLLSHGLAAVFEPVTAIKLCGIFLLYATALLMSRLAFALTGSMWGAACAAALYLHGHMRVELLVNFLKQSLGHFWIVLLILLLVKFADGYGGRRVFLLAGVALLAMGSHAMSGAIAALTLAAVALYRFAMRRTAAEHGALRLTWGIGLAAVWFATWAVAVALVWQPALWPAGARFVQTFPHSGAALLRDTLSPPPLFPRAAWITLIFAAALAYCLIRARTFGAPAAAALAAVLPVTAFAFDPFFVPWPVNPMGIHLRMVAALCIATPVVIGLAILALPIRPRARVFLYAGMALSVTLPPPYWAGHSGPPPDRGRLHDGMAEMGERTPRDAIIITDLPRGNMAQALWKLPWVESVPPYIALEDARYHRLVFIPYEALESFEEILRYNEASPPIEIVPPWYLVREMDWLRFGGVLGDD